MNYESLKTAIQSYVENEFTTTDINVFITQAEQRIYNTVQIAYLRKNVTGALDRNIGQDSDFGRAMSANVGAINEGISHNVKQVGIGGQMLGNMLQGGIKSLMSLGQGGGGGGGSGGGGGAMGPNSGGLARLGASKLQRKKPGGMSRRQTYLTKA